MRLHEAMKLLLVREKSTLQEVHRNYITLAHTYHPDKCGGARGKWDELQEAYRLVTEDLKRPRVCVYCSGTSQRAVMRRGKYVTIPCEKCAKE